MIMETTAPIPMQLIGPIKIIGLNGPNPEEIQVPLATYEIPLWPSTNRGARVSVKSGGIRATLLQDFMTRSIVLEGLDAAHCHQVINELQQQFQEMAALVSENSRFAKLQDWHWHAVGKLLYLRFDFTTGDASGHNMATKAAEAIQNWLLQKYPFMEYVSISGNWCADKKVSGVNSTLGRGKYVICELTVPRQLCRRYLKSTPEKITDLNLKKNHIGSTIAGGLHTANAHFANMLLAFYLATGQDAANIIEGSQGIVYCEVTAMGDLYFSVTLPNIIVGTVGNGKHLNYVRNNLQLLGCDQSMEPGKNAQRLALIAGATVLCGELSLLAAQTNPGELMESHIRLERKSQEMDHA